MQHHKETRLQLCPPHLNTVATLPCKMSKSGIALYNNQFILSSECIGSDMINNSIKMKRAKPSVRLHKNSSMYHVLFFKITLWIWSHSGAAV